MSQQNQQVLAAPGPGATPESERQTSQGAPGGRPADGEANLTEAALRAEFSRGRASRRGQGSAAPVKSRDPANNATPQTDASTETPPDDATNGDRSTNSASASAEDTTVEALASGDEAGSSQAPYPAAPKDIDLDDPESLEGLTDDQIKAIKEPTTRKLVRRIHRLTARLREAEAKTANPEPREATPESVPQSGDRYDAHPRIAPIASKIANIEAAIEWAEQNPDGGQFKGLDGKTMEFSAEQVANILRKAPRELGRLETARQIQVEAVRAQEGEVQRAAVETAKAAYPWLADRASDEYVMAAQIAKDAPYVTQHPEWLLWVADAVAGRRARESRAANGAQQPKSRPTPNKIPTPGGAAAPRVDQQAKALAEAEAEFEKTGSEAALKRVMSLQRAMKRR